MDSILIIILLVVYALLLRICFHGCWMLYDVGFQTSSSLTENAWHSELVASGFLFPLYKRMKGIIHGIFFFLISEFIIISEALSQISQRKLANTIKQTLYYNFVGKFLLSLFQNCCLVYIYRGYICKYWLYLGCTFCTFQWFITY